MSLKSVLVSAYCCDPTQGSEPGVGWEFLKATLASADEVWLITRGKNRQPVLDALTEVDRKRLHIVTHELGRWAQTWKRKLPIGVHLYYSFWQRSAIPILTELHDHHQFDAAIHLTLGADWLPCALSSVPNLRYVWGPVGGSTYPPLALWRYFGFRGCAIEVIRWATGSAGRAIFGCKTARNARVVVGYNSDEINSIGRWAPVLVESTAALDEFKDRTDTQRDPQLILGVGRLLPWKGWALAIEAMAHLPSTYRLEILGQGPDLGRLRRVAKKFGVADRVTFVSWLPARADVFDRICVAHAMVFPSMRESGGWVVAEAVATRTPVIALDIGGPAYILEQSGGSALESAPTDTLAIRLAQALRGATACPTTERWNRQRLPSTVRSWLERAASTRSTDPEVCEKGARPT